MYDILADVVKNKCNLRRWYALVISAVVDTLLEHREN
jgi:hypothetical protein